MALRTAWKDGVGSVYATIVHGVCSQIQCVSSTREYGPYWQPIDQLHEMTHNIENDVVIVFYLYMQDQKWHPFFSQIVFTAV